MTWIDFPSQQVVTQTKFTLQGLPTRITVVRMTPELATKLLERNTKNRTISNNRLLQLKRDMQEGNWDFNGATVTFSYDGALLDSQHRLRAIEDSGVTIPMIVVEGLDPAVSGTIDQGKPRTVGDILTFRGLDISHKAICIATAINLLNAEQGRSFARTEVADYVEKHVSELEPVAVWAGAMSREAPMTKMRIGINRSILSPSPLAALYIYMTRKGADPEQVRFFFDGVCSGLATNTIDHKTFGTLRKRLIEIQPLANLSGGTGGSIMLSTFDMIVNVYNRWVADEAVVVIRPPKDKKFKTLADVTRPTGVRKAQFGQQ